MRDLPAPILVETERLIPGGSGRVDILVSGAQGALVAIETKVSASPDKSQLERYQRAYPNAAVRLLTTSFDREILRAMPEPHLALDDLAELAAAIRPAHPLVKAYHEWLQDQVGRRDDAKARAEGSDPRRIIEALATPEGVWFFTRRVLTALGNPAGKVYLDTSLGGWPWAQFWFADETEQRDALFYRIDGGERPGLSVKQYQGDPQPDIQAKRARLQILQAAWDAAVGEAGVPLKDEKMRTPRGKSEWAIAYYYLKDNDPLSILGALRRIHMRFIDRIRASGWHVLDQTSSKG